MEKKYEYRSEIPFGEGYRNILDVMTHEIYELNNTDILETLKNTILKQEKKLVNDINEILDDIEKNIFFENHCEYDIREFMKECLKMINKKYKKDIKYCLWLADKNVVIDYYGKGKLSEDDIDKYQVSDIILSDLGYDGRLYGYEEYPKKEEK